MSTCVYCGKEITFRQVDGRSVPFHSEGTRCREPLGFPKSSAMTSESSSVVYEDYDRSAHLSKRCEYCKASIKWTATPIMLTTVRRE